MKHVGTFQCPSGKFRVSDPCYDDTVFCAGTVKKAAKGVWKGFAALVPDEDVPENERHPEQTRCAALLALHQSVRSTPEDMFRVKIWCRGDGVLKFSFKRYWWEEPFEVGVDSGKAGIFDEKYYRAAGNKPDEERFNDLCFNAIYDKRVKNDGVAIIEDKGIVSFSGYGDGGYGCYTHQNKDGLVVGVIIDYLGWVRDKAVADILTTADPSDLPTFIGLDIGDKGKALLEAKLAGSR